MQFIKNETPKEQIKRLASEIKCFFSPGRSTNVYNICRQLGIDIEEADIKADAYLKCENGETYIVLKKSLSDNRKKFTIAHELGHFNIPWHSELMFGCDISEMDFKKDYGPREQEANFFAAELLMPTDTFKSDFSGYINYTEVSGLAQKYEVSFQASLNRCIDLAKEDCMIVCSANRNVKWFKATEDFPLFLRLGKINKMSVADELFDIKVFDRKTSIEPSYIWFSNADDGDIEEESIFFPAHKEVISIIHLKK